MIFTFEQLTTHLALTWIQYLLQLFTLLTCQEASIYVPLFAISFFLQVSIDYIEPNDSKKAVK